MDKQILGIDFGTANSYFCKYLSDPDGHKIRTIDFGNNQIGGISTSILYREGRAALVGTTAEQEWGEASAKERKQYRIRTHFKPDIVRSNEARQDAIHYLKTIAEQMEARRVDFAPQNHQVIIGIPGEAGESFSDALKSVAREAGYGDVKLVYEPIGAMLYHLWNKDLTPAETQRGVLVVDFGGGTCDFAFMQRLEVYRSWGDMYLGGRLFDDLFFQWFLEQNPSALKKLVKEGNEYYVHWFECRRVKELFSETMSLNRKEQVRVKLGQMRDYGVFKDLDWESFLARARSYRPHETFLRDLKARHLEGGRLLENKAVDLLEWFRQTLRGGLEKNNIRANEIEKVILTGGSSQWPFVLDIVCEELKIDTDRLLTSENPKAAISEGLVVLPSLQQRFDKASKNLRSGLDSFFSRKMEPEINRRIESTIDSILDDISIRLYDDQISPILYDYREKGGAIESVKDRVKAATYKFEPELEEIVRNKMTELSDALPPLLHKMVSDWFRENGITYYGAPASGKDAAKLYAGPRTGTEPRSVTRLYEEMVNTFGGFGIVVAAGIVAGISGGGGTALIASGPIGLLIGALIAVVLGFLTLEYGKDQAREMVEKIELSPRVIKLFLWESKIDAILADGRTKLQKQLYKSIRAALDEPFNDIHRQIVHNIEREIDSLSLINQL